MKERLKVPVERLRRTCHLDELLQCATTEEAPPLEGFIGQERAVRSMQFGLKMKAPGYNIYVAGPPGTGRTTYTQAVVKEVAARGPTPGDWCYLYNFKDPDRPLAVMLPAGWGSQLQKDMEELVTDLKVAIPKAFEGTDYEQQRQAIVQTLQTEMEAAMEKLHKEAGQQGFSMQQGPAGFVFIPRFEGRLLSPAEFEQLPAEKRKEIEAKGKALERKLQEIMHRGRLLEKEVRQRIRELERQIALQAASPFVEKLKAKYDRFGRVVEYLGNMLEDVANSLDQFRGGDEAASAPPGMMAVPPGEDRMPVRYRVNLFVNNDGARGAPVVVETSPSYYNLFGKIEYRSHMGTFFTDFTMIKAGAIHRANGGYLILQMKDVIWDFFAWDALKRALKNRQVVVENIGEQYRMVPTVSLKPEPICLDVKVILIGSLRIYQILHFLDEDFSKFFKVKVDFDTEMERNPENLCNYTSFVSSVCRRDGLKHFDQGALARLVEYSSRLAGRQDKLSTRFNEVVEIIYEAHSMAMEEGAEVVTAAHVQKAIEEKVYRSNRIEEKIWELMLKGKILVDTSGAAVGQVNGLSILDVGDYVFGRPSRITARTFMGEEGVVNIERETRMSGHIHSKGVLTLAGYLGGKFAQDKPLCLSARITFEQLYEGVDGDSASSTELYAILSSLSGLPIKQGIAVTGSVNQHGEIQPIGGVTEKIEGFFAVCKARGLSGDQGVMIPAQNVDNLMLKEEVVEAVRGGKFHIWAVRTVEEGIELLTGVPAGERRPDGSYPEGTVFGLVDRTLRLYAEGMARHDRAGVALRTPQQAAGS